MVARGEQIEVMDRGRLIAMLVPIGGTQWEALLASQRVALPTDQADVSDEQPADYGIDASGALQAMREAER